MQTTWILAADASHARIFEFGGGDSALRQVEGFEHPAGRAHISELTTDAGGRHYGVGGVGGNTSQPAQDAAQHEVETFSRSLCAYLDSAQQQHRFDELCVIAPPTVLGAIRRQLSKETQQLVLNEIPRDVAWLDARQMEEYLTRGVIH
jgi:protein required for attachment to host cells